MSNLKLRVNPVGVPYRMPSSTANTLLVIVGNRLRALRMARGVTQQDCGDAVGLDHSTLSMYERGARQPTLDALIALARYYEVPLAEIVNEDDI